MASIDNRIVNMEFNNAEFEKRVSDTLKSLAGLDKAIADMGSKDGLKGLQASASTFHMDGVTSAIEGVSNKFLAMSTIGITALATITSKAVEAGLSIGKSLTIENVGAGFAEYELKMGSIQTIMAGSGADLATVNSKLKELNTYSDKTIYSFADMTQNIGKFTNAGISLDQSVASIQGIANVAAISGANSEEASRAMYNFAQALSKGYVQLVDWKSIELANMGTSEFKDQLLQAGVAAGTLTKRGDEYVTKNGTRVTATKNFNDSLQDQWLTTEALNKTLGDYANANTEIGQKAFAAAQDIKTFTQLVGTVKESIGSGWSESFELIIGNFEEAKMLWSDVGQTISGMVGRNAEARNNILQGWQDMGGRWELFAGIRAGLEAFWSVLEPIRGAFRDIFPAMTAERLYNLTHQFHLFMIALQPSHATIDAIKRIFTGLFNVLNIGIEVIKFVVKAIAGLVLGLTGLGKGNALQFFAKLGDVLASLDAEVIIGALERGLGRLVELLKVPIPYIERFIEKIEEFMKSIDIDTSDIGGSFGKFLEKIKGWFSDLGSLPDVGGPIANAFNVMKEALSDIGGFLSGVLSGIDIGGVIGDVLSTIGGAFSGIIDAIAGMFSAGGELPTKVKESADGIPWDMVMGGVGIAMVGGLIATVNRLINNGINIDFTGGVLSSISDTFGQLTSTLKTMQQDIKSDIILKIAAAIGVLALAMIAISFIEPEKLVKSAVAIGFAFAQLAAAMAIIKEIDFSTSDAAKFTLMAIGFGILAGGMLLLSAAVLAMGSMDIDTLAKGMGAFAAVVAAIVIVSKSIEDEAAGMAKAAFSMILMAFAMDGMYAAISKFGSMEWDAMKQGFIGVAGAMLLLVAVMKLMPDDMKEKTTGVLGFSIALNVLVFAIKTLGEMDLAVIVQGGIAFAGMLGLLVLAMNKMPKDMGVSAGQMLALAAAMGIMAIALKIFGGMGWEEMARGLIGMAASLIILVVAMTAAEEGIFGAGAILIMAAALLVLSVAIKAFAAIGLGEFAKGMILVIAALALLAGTAYLLTPAILPLLALGVALAALGAGFALIGVGAAQLAKAVAIFAKVKDVGDVIWDVLSAIGQAIPALLSGVADGIVAMIGIFMKAIPLFVEFVIKIITGVLEILTTLLPKFGEFIVALVQTILDVIVELTPSIVTAGLNLLLALIQGIAENISEIVGVVVTVITEFINAIAENLPKIIEAGLNLLKSFIEGILSYVSFIADMVVTVITTFIEEIAGHYGEILAAGTEALVQFLLGISNSLSTIIATVTQVITQFITDLASMANDIVTAGADALVSFLQGISDNIGTIITTVTDMIIQFVADVATNMWRVSDAGSDVLIALLDELTADIIAVLDAVTDMIGQIIWAVGQNLDELVEAGTDIIVSLLEKMGDSAIRIGNAIGDFALDIAQAVEDNSEKFESAGRSIAGSLLDGMTFGLAGKAGGLIKKAGNISGSVLDEMKEDWQVESPSKVMIELGHNIMDGLSIGLDRSANKTISTASDVSGDVLYALSNALSTVSDDLSASSEFNPVITPVIDLANVRAGASEIQGLLARNSTTQAGSIAASQRYTEDSLVGAGPTEIKFEQTINAPTQLSTADIYRQTRNQITIAKEELKIA